MSIVILTVVLVGMLGTELVTAAPSLSSGTPTLFSKYGIVRVLATKNIGSLGSGQSFTVSVNSTLGPIYIEQLQLVTNQQMTSGGSLNVGITIDGTQITPANPIAVLQSSITYSDVIVGMSAFSVHDPVGNMAVVANRGVSGSVSVALVLTLQGGTFPSGTIFTAIATVAAPGGTVTITAI